MKRFLLLTLAGILAFAAEAQQWDGATDPNGLINRNGNVGINGLWMGRYGSLFAGDSNPYTFYIPHDAGAHDLMLYGSNAATLNLRLYDGDLKMGGYDFPNARIFNDGSAYFKNSVSIGHSNLPKAHLVVGHNFGATISGAGSGQAIFGSNLAVYNIGANANSLYTPYNHASYGYAGIKASSGRLTFYTSYGQTTEGEVVTPEPRMMINSAGNVGIGVPATEPINQRFRVDHTAQADYANAMWINSKNPNIHWPLLITSNGNANYSGFISSATSDIYMILRNGSNQATAQIQSNGSTYFNGGNVGIGTNAPSSSYKLDVNGAVRTKHIVAQEHLTINKAGSSGPYRLALNGQAHGYIVGRDDAAEDKFTISANGISYLNGGKVGIGTKDPDEALTVKGTIHTHEVRVDTDPIVVPDYVFEEDYNLLSLEQTEAYIKKHKHLPDVPSAAELGENGMNLKEMNLILLKKIEELTLHVIELEKEVKELKSSKK